MSSSSGSGEKRFARVVEISQNDENVVLHHGSRNSSWSKSLLLGLLIMSLLLVSCVIFFGNINGNSSCPQSEIEMTDSQGNVYNLEQFIFESSGNTTDEDTLHVLVDELLLSFGNGEVSHEDNLHELKNDGRRRLAQASPEYGGNGGSSFQLQKSGKYITGIKIWYDGLVRGIQVRFSDNTWSSIRGGTGYSSRTTYGNCFSAVSIRSGRLVDGIQFLYRSGSNYRLSNFMGGGGGGAAVFNSDGCLKVIDGRSGSAIDQLQFIFD